MLFLQTALLFTVPTFFMWFIDHVSVAGEQLYQVWFFVRLMSFFFYLLIQRRKVKIPCFFSKFAMCSIFYSAQLKLTCFSMSLVDVKVSFVEL